MLVQALGFFKGLYDEHIFPSAFDVIRPEARGTAAGFMNTVGWLGGATAPFITGIIARNRGLGFGITLASIVYIMAGVLLLLAELIFAPRDVFRLNSRLAALAHYNHSSRNLLNCDSIT